MSKLTRIHVNQHNIKANARWRELCEEALVPEEHVVLAPVITVKDYKENRKGFEAVIGDGVAKVVYSPDKPLPCGAKVWIETREEVTVT